MEKIRPAQKFCSTATKISPAGLRERGGGGGARGTPLISGLLRPALPAVTGGRESRTSGFRRCTRPREGEGRWGVEEAGVAEAPLVAVEATWANPSAREPSVPPWMRG